MRNSVLFKDMSFRYLVKDIEESVRFYGEQLGFELVEKWGSAFAIVRRGELTIWLSGPGSSAARTLTDGAVPTPGGWNRVVLQCDHLDVFVEELKHRGVTFRSEPVSGPGGRQILIEDPSGNPIELFETA